jgi:hypothetical protein
VARNLEEKIVWKSRHRVKDNTNIKLEEYVMRIWIPIILPRIGTVDGLFRTE